MRPAPPSISADSAWLRRCLRYGRGRSRRHRASAVQRSVRIVVQPRPTVIRSYPSAILGRNLIDAPRIDELAENQRRAETFPARPVAEANPSALPFDESGIRDQAMSPTLTPTPALAFLWLQRFKRGSTEILWRRLQYRPAAVMWRAARPDPSCNYRWFEKCFSNSFCASASPSSVKSTDFALDPGSETHPFSNRTAIRSQFMPFHTLVP